MAGRCHWCERARDLRGRKISLELAQVPPSSNWSSGGKGGAPGSPGRGSVVEEKLLFSVLPTSRTGKFREESVEKKGAVLDSPSGWYMAVDALRLSEKLLSFELDLEKLFVAPAGKGSQLLHFSPLRCSSFIFLSFSTSSVIFCIRKFCVFSRRIDSTRVSSPLGFSCK